MDVFLVLIIVRHIYFKSGQWRICVFDKTKHLDFIMCSRFFEVLELLPHIKNKLGAILLNIILIPTGDTL